MNAGDRAAWERINGSPLTDEQATYVAEHGYLPREPGDEEWEFVPADEPPPSVEEIENAQPRDGKPMRNVDFPDGLPAERPPIPAPVPLGSMVETHKALKRLLIDGVLRFGEILCINAKAKLRKSWAMYAIAICVAAGLYWLGKFRCNRGRVLIVDFELHPETIARRIPKVAEKMGVPLADIENSIDVLCMRGRLRDIFALEQLFKTIEHGKYALVILDALYRILPPNASENDNAAMAQVFNAIDQYADMTGAAFAVVHHQSKGAQYDKDVVDVGSGASAFARAVDAHLVLRQHEDDGQVVLDGALRSWEPLTPMVLQWDFPVWKVVEDGDPAALKGRRSAGDERQVEKDRDGIKAIAECIRDGKADPATPSAIRRSIGMGRDRTERLLGIMETAGQVTWEEATVQRNKTRIYSLTGVQF